MGISAIPPAAGDSVAWVRLREKGGKRHEMPCHHNLETYLHAYLDGGGIAADSKGPLFRTIGRTTGQLITTPLPQANAHAMIRRRRHQGRQSHLPGDRDHGVSEKRRLARKRPVMANHASTRTTQLYDRRRDEVNLDEVERISI
jgi:hypothetical protein